MTPHLLLLPVLLATLEMDCTMRMGTPVRSGDPSTITTLVARRIVNLLPGEHCNLPLLSGATGHDAGVRLERERTQRQLAWRDQKSTLRR